jgi:hypothetical protein
VTDPLFDIGCEGVIIGRSAFECRGLPRRVLRGVFLPSAAYEQVRRILQADAVARARPEDPESETLLRAHYYARDQLRFEITDATGKPITIEYFHIYEPVRSGAAYEVVARLAVPPSGNGVRSRRRRHSP